jgi:radical SAM superfamily enzyme YgiQ (UPF0313 family)
VLERAGYEVAVINMLLDNLRPADLMSILQDFRPDVVGVSCSMAFVSEPAVQVARVVKEISPEVVVIMGGNHATYEFRDIMEQAPMVDYIVRFEGEEATLELIDAIRERRDPRGMPGVVGRSACGIWVGRDRKPIQELDSIPPPARYLMNMFRYGRDSRGIMVTSRGCPYACAYCSTSAFNGRKIRAHSVKRVVHEIQEVYEQYDVRHIMFVDDTFTFSTARINRLCAEMKKRCLPAISWACETRVDLVNPALLSTMRESGCTGIFYGIETVNQATLNRMNKGFSVARAREACRWTKAAGIQVQQSFIVGLPGDTPEMAERVLEFISETQPDHVLFNSFIVYPGTPLMSDPSSFGIRSYCRDWSRSEQARPMVETDTMTADEIRRTYVRLVTGLQQILAEKPVFQSEV